MNYHLVIWLFLKQSGGPVCGLATVGQVEYHENLTPQKDFGLWQRFDWEGNL